jgi:tetratricopeptide (TPR) repeat protein
VPRFLSNPLLTPLNALGLGLWLSALCAGAVPAPALFGYAGCLLFAALLEARSRGAEVPRFEGRASLFWCALVVYCGLQTIPLPLGVVKWLTPPTAVVWETALRPFQVPPPNWASLSLAPGRGRVEAFKLATTAVAFVLGARNARRHGLVAVLACLYGSAVLVAVVTAAHQALGLERVYGFYPLAYATQVAPLPNGNCRAGYLLLGALAGLGWLGHRGQARRAPIALGLVVIGAELLLCHSRAGALCFALALGGLGAWTAVGRRRRKRAAVSWLLAIGATAGSVFVAATGRGAWSRLTEGGFEKIALLHNSLRLALRYPLLGVGRGAFGSVLPSVQAEVHEVSFEHAENFALQWAAEWGFGVGGVTCVVLGTVLVRASLAARGWAQRSACVGLWALLLQNLVDLGFEVPALAGAAAALLGALLAAQRPSPASTSPAHARRTSGLALASAACLVSGLCAAIAGSPDLALLRQEVQDSLKQPFTAPSQNTTLRAAVGAFPAEAYFFQLGAHSALGSTTPALPWAARALERSPNDPETHRLLAVALDRAGAHAQAKRALRRAAEFTTQFVPEARVAATAIELFPDFPDLSETVPTGPRALNYLLELAKLSSNPDLRLSLLRAADQAGPEDPRPAARLSWYFWSELQGQRSTHCDGDLHVCLQAAAYHVAQARERHRSGTPSPEAAPGSDLTWLQIAILRRLAQTDQAQQALVGDCAGRTTVACGRARLELSLENPEALKSAADAYLASACRSPQACAQALLEVGQLLAEERPERALHYYRRAIEEWPSEAAYLALATLAERSGLPGEAERARQRAQQLEPAP